MKDKITAYKELLEVVKKHYEVIEEDYVISPSGLENFITRLEVSDTFGIPLRNIKDSYDGWLHVKGCYDDWMILGHFGEQQRRTISWSDDGSQPEDEWLFRVGFSTGAYIFSRGIVESSYPKYTFQAFFDELKTYSPKYCDSANHCLYFTKENAKAVYDDFWPIFAKYKDLVGEELKQKRTLELEAELAKLKGE